MALHLQHPSHTFTRFFPPPTSSFLVSPAFFVSYTTQKQGSSEFPATILTRCHVASASDPSSYTIYVLVSLNPQSHFVDPTLGIVGHLNYSAWQLIQKPVGSCYVTELLICTRTRNRPLIFDPSEVQYSSSELQYNCSFPRVRLGSRNRSIRVKRSQRPTGTPLKYHPGHHSL